MRRWTVADLEGAELCWLLTIQHRGRELRWSSRPVTTTDADGRVRPYDGGLDLDTVSTALSGPGGDAAIPSASFDLLMPADLDYPAEEEADWSLAGCVGELALWAVGTSHESRRVVINGIIEEPEYGDADEPVSVTLTAAPWDISTLYPPPEASITAETWPEAVDDAVGKSYPVIIGCPGEYEVSPTTVAPGSPAYPVEWSVVLGVDLVDTLLIADGWVEATSVVLIYDEGSGGAVNVTRRTDGLGRQVSVLDISGLSTAIRGSASYHIAWRASTGGGIMGPTGGTMRGAGDALAWALRTSGRPVDVGRFEAAAAELNRYRVGIAIEEPCDLYEWAQEHIMPLLPAEIVHTGDGLAPVIWRYNARAADAVAHLVEGENVTAAARVKRSPVADVVNRLSLSWAFDVAEGDYRRTTSTTTELDPDTDAAQGGVVANISERRYGPRAQEIEAEAVYDRATATLAMAWRLELYGLPWRSTSYEGGQELGALYPGDVVTITDTGRAWSQRVAIVSGVHWQSEHAVTLDLLLFTVPARDRRT